MEAAPTTTSDAPTPPPTPTLTPGFVKELAAVAATAGAAGADGGRMATLQVLGFKLTTTKNGERYRVALSDGEHVVNAIVSAALSAQFEAREIDKHAVVELAKYTVSTLNGLPVVIVQEMAVLDKNVGAKIGAPTPLQAVEGAKDAAAAVKDEPEKDNAAAMAVAYPTPTKTPERPNAAAAAAATGPVADVFPIEALNPYQNRWSIKVRVTQKTEIRTFKNARGEGQLFSVDLTDESGEIRGTAFGDQVGKLYNVFEKNKIYVVSKGQVKPSVRKFNTLRNQYEITFDATTTVTPCDGEDAIVPKMFYHFVPIDQIERIPKDAHIDLIGVLKEVSDVTTISPKSDPNKKMLKRDVKLVDMSLKEVTVALWGDVAETFGTPALGTIVAFKALRVSDYNGRSLSTGFSTIVRLNPDEVPEVQQLQSWYASGGSTAAVTSISTRMSPNGKDEDPMTARYTFQRANDEKMGADDKPAYFNLRCTVTQIPHEKAIWYPAEPETGNKMVQQSDGSWLSEKTQKTYKACDYRYLLRFIAIDATGSSFVNAFGDDAVQIMGLTAADLVSLKEANADRYEAVFAKACFRTFVMRIRAKTESYQGESRVKYAVVGSKPVDYKSESQLLLRQLRLYGY